MHPRQIRPFFRIVSLIFFVACGAAGVSWGVAASPFVAGNILVSRSLPLATGSIGLIALVACVARRRWFCRWACPVGLLLRQTRRLSKSPGRILKMRLGRWLALASLGGAAFGLPLLLWLDPIVLFTAGFGVLYQPARIGAAAALAILAVILVVSLSDRGLWCRCLCPAGGIQDVCAAWRFLIAKRTATRPNPARGRRAVLVGLASATVFGFGAILGKSGRRLVRSSRLRPPGAVDEATFAGLCSRCGNCVRACPAGIIRPLTNGRVDVLTPTLTFTDAYCREDCVRCTEVCPTGALEQVTLEQKPAVKIGRGTGQLGSLQFDLRRRMRHLPQSVSLRGGYHCVE